MIPDTCPHCGGQVHPVDGICMGCGSMVGSVGPDLMFESRLHELRHLYRTLGRRGDGSEHELAGAVQRILQAYQEGA